MTETSPTPSTLEYEERPRSAFWDKFIAIVALLIAAGSLWSAMTYGSILAPSWLRLTVVVFSHPQRWIISRIWISSTLEMVDQSVGATLALLLVFAAGGLLKGASGASRWMRRCAIARPVAAFFGAIAKLAFDPPRTMRPELEQKVWWSSLKVDTIIVAISLVTSVILLAMLRVNDARKLRPR